MKRCATTYALVVVFGILAALAPARAQEGDADTALEPPRPSQGYYLTLGLHGGTVQARDDGRGVGALGGFSGTLHFGQSINTWMDLGLVLEVGSVLVGERSGLLASFGIDWTLRPFRELFVRLSTSFGVNQLSAAPNSDNAASAFGVVAGVTVGYAWFPWASPRHSGGWAFSPVARLSAVQPFSDNAGYWSMVGFEVTWWKGLPKAQLDLSLDEAFTGSSR